MSQDTHIAGETALETVFRAVEVSAPELGKSEEAETRDEI